MPPPKDEGRAALLAGLGAYGVWGFLPLYFHLLGNLGVSTPEMIAHRTLWSVFWAAGLVWLARQGPEVSRVLREPRTLGLLALSTLAILINWTIYVVAVDANKVIEASLGYYINPLVNVLLGTLVLGERLNRRQWCAVALAAAGVAVVTRARATKANRTIMRSNLSAPRWHVDERPPPRRDPPSSGASHGPEYPRPANAPRSSQALDRHASGAWDRHRPAAAPPAAG